MTAPGGIIAAAPSPMDAALRVRPEAVAGLLDHLLGQGCHGALLLGSTGEGPSFDLGERRALLEAARDWRMARGAAQFQLLAGTGCSAIPDSIAATRTAFELGLDGVLVLPPFYFKAVGEAGLEAAFAQIFDAAVPDAGRLYLYHIPRLSGLAIGSALIDSLRRRFGPRLAGVKDSGGDLAHTLQLIRAHPDLAVYTGQDGHLLPALQAGAAGGITALASLRGDLARAVYDAWSAGEMAEAARAQARLDAARIALDRWPTVAAVKAALALMTGMEAWPLRPPLEALEHRDAAELAELLADSRSSEVFPPRS